MASFVGDHTLSSVKTFGSPVTEGATLDGETLPSRTDDQTDSNESGSPTMPPLVLFVTWRDRYQRLSRQERSRSDSVLWDDPVIEYGELLEPHDAPA